MRKYILIGFIFTFILSSLTFQKDFAYANESGKYEIDDVGEHVVQLKLDLTNLGFGKFPADPSENYGNITAGVVKEFQEYYNLPESGAADETTLAKIAEVLNPPYKVGDRGQAIAQLKKDLTNLGFGNFPPNPSIFYGEVTANVVSDFQQENELEVTGETNIETLTIISELLNASSLTGDQVVQLKKNLTELGFGSFPSNPSKNYGNVTINVVKEFQVYAGLPVSGVANERTLAKVEEVLNPPYKNGDQGLAVTKLKQDLTSLGYGNFPVNPSINYGQVTSNVVAIFQQENSLSVTGEANAETLGKIVEQLNGSASLSGEEIVQLKKDLTELGFGKFPANPSENYGNVTTNVVKEFQAYAHLPPSGIADEATLAKLNVVLNPPYKDGDRGQAIVQLKQDLTRAGFGTFPASPSINYGQVTANVVTEFQITFNLDASGIADAETLNKLSIIAANEGYEEKELQKEVVVTFETIEKEDPTLDRGTTKVEQEGVDGKNLVTYTITYYRGEEIDRVEKSSDVIVEPIDEIVIIGTKEPIEDAEPTEPEKPIEDKEPTEPTEPEEPIEDKEPIESEDSITSQILQLVNEERIEQGLNALEINEEVQRLANLKAQDMVDNDYYGHTSPTYGTAFDMLKGNGITYLKAGENIAAGFVTPESVMAGWMISQGHKDNILDPSYTQIGVGYDERANIWVQIFIAAR